MYKMAPLGAALFFSLLLMPGFCDAQVAMKIIAGEKVVYSTGDEVTVAITITVDPKTCKDGMNMTKIYASGLEIKNKETWKELKTGIWQNHVNCVFNNHKKGNGVLTILRRTDKDQLMQQLKFNTRID